MTCPVLPNWQAPTQVCATPKSRPVATSSVLSPEFRAGCLLSLYQAAVSPEIIWNRWAICSPNPMELPEHKGGCTSQTTCS